MIPPRGAGAGVSLADGIHLSASQPIRSDGAGVLLDGGIQLSASQPISGVGGGREGSIRSWGGGGMVVDAEIVGIDRQSGRLRAFQVLSPESYILYPSL